VITQSDIDTLSGKLLEYIYSQKLPNGQEIADMLPEAPRILERQGIIDRIRSAIQNIVDVFEW